MRKGNKLIQEGKVPKKRTLNTQVLTDIVNGYYLDGIEAGYKAGYDKGYEEGAKCQDEVQYQKGLEDAWDAARKIYAMTANETIAVFGGCSKWVDYSAIEAIEKIRAYEEKQKRDCDTECANSPCHLCRFSPPGSGDGKPCTMCPAEGKVEE